MNVVALAGGVGGAKLASGLSQAMNPEDLTVIVNTGDDFEHLGLMICPDLDTVCYTLAGLANPLTGWGRAGDTWFALETMGELGGPTWFRLGDRDLGLHLERTRRLQTGETLSQITRHICQVWGISARVMPMSDDRVSTWVYTKEAGELPFQEYFVGQACRPQVTGFRFENSERARPAPGVLDALQMADVVVICPSNPWVSIAPILSVPGMHAALEGQRVLAVSPIVGGQAIKGPAAKMYRELGIEPSAMAVAQHYGALLAGFVLDSLDEGQASQIRAIGVHTLVTNTIMNTAEDRIRLARQVLEFRMQIEEKSPNR